MEPKSDVAAAAVTLIAGLLIEESELIWNQEKTGTVWRLAPVSSEPVPHGRHRQPERRLRISPADSDSTAGAFEICILDYTLTESFLLYVSEVLYDVFGLLTEAAEGNPAPDIHPDRGVETHSRDKSADPLNPDDKSSAGGSSLLELITSRGTLCLAWNAAAEPGRPCGARPEVAL